MTTRSRRTDAAAAGAFVLACLPAAAASAECRPVAHDGAKYTVCEAVAGDDEVRLWHSDDEGDVLGSFDRIEAHLARDGLTLGFAMNAGMYHPDRSPVGLYTEEGESQASLVTQPGPGNFGMLPNGVFCVHADRFSVVETRRFDAAQPDCRHATQSGPMLVIDGALHPRFLHDSTSRFVRNGVGVSQDGTRAFFAISEHPVTFYSFGRLFRDKLDTPQALYFDGNVSRLHAPALNRSDWGRRMGPVVGTVRPAE